MNPTAENYITNLLTPYFTGEEKFGYDEDLFQCQYLTDSGYSCAFGKACKNPQIGWVGDAADILMVYGKKVLTQKAKDARLTSQDWLNVQMIHDVAAIASRNEDVLPRLNIAIGELAHIGLFTDLRATISEWHKKASKTEARPS